MATECDVPIAVLRDAAVFLHTTTNTTIRTSILTICCVVPDFGGNLLTPPPWVVAAPPNHNYDFHLFTRRVCLAFHKVLGKETPGSPSCVPAGLAIQARWEIDHRGGCPEPPPSNAAISDRETESRKRQPRDSRRVSTRTTACVVDETGEAVVSGGPTVRTSQATVGPGSPTLLVTTVGARLAATSAFPSVFAFGRTGSVAGPGLVAEVEPFAEDPFRPGGVRRHRRRAAVGRLYGPYRTKLVKPS